jgi:outer membrane protein TolC
MAGNCHAYYDSVWHLDGVMKLDRLGNAAKGKSKLLSVAILLVPLSIGPLINGCRSPKDFRQNADKVADQIIVEKQKQALGKTEPFTIERPSETLRRRVLGEQGLQYSSKASLGTSELRPVTGSPDNGQPSEVPSADANVPIEPNRPLRVSLMDALQIGARNSAEYQSRKEQVFQAALDLDLARNNFRNLFAAALSGSLNTNTSGTDVTSTADTSATGGVSRQFINGASVSSSLAVDLARLMTQGGSPALRVNSDTSVTIPLLGAGRLSPAENLTIAERNVVYRIWDFERYKRTFAVSVASSYFTVLRGIDSVTNAQANYRSAATSARWSRRQTEAGRLSEIQTDQASQRELSARNSWILAQEDLKSRLDSFKSLIGLPTDARVEVDTNDLTQLRSAATKMVEEIKAGRARVESDMNVPANAPVQLIPANYEGAGPLEMDETMAVRLALLNRLDLRQAIGKVYDAQRQVVIKAEALGTELSLGGKANFVDTDADGRLHFDGGSYTALLNLDLPIERTAERNAYRSSLISLEQAVRSVQTLEDQIKLSIRDELRTLLESRESLKIQAQSVVLAEKQVDSSNMLLEAGRIEIRDLLTAQDSLLSAQNSLTAAAVNYRTAELGIQRDLDLLKVNEQGIWQEFSPGELKNGSQQRQQ